MRIDLLKEPVAVGDSYLLCSDGLWGLVTEDEIHLTLKEHTPEAASDTLLISALKRGGVDNVTAVAFTVREAPAAPASPSRWLNLRRRGGA